MEYKELKLLKSINCDIYKEDSVQFNILSLILESEHLELYSDNSHIIICRSSPDTAVWIWTDYTITKDNSQMLYECIYNEFEINTNITFVIKPVMCDIIKKVIKDKIGKDSCIITDMMTYHCVEPIQPKDIDGFMQQADLSDIDIIAGYRADDLKEMNNINTSKEEQSNNSKSLIESGNLYVWKNSDGDITSIAFVAHRSQEQARINRVYTAPKYRNKGYAGMLMYELSKMLLNEGRIPVVYTDNTYPASNKAYKKVGYRECGGLYEIGLNK
ncbi:GNAT family N-acetyltransferase [Clostridium sp. YIM B02515]|uniref:GNAT family N-acetyltransferase n=1 Tax=Clostridium rhizosphaerae TaxID=2803861 RepID=A0ABS1TE28_9CLOT|nr:GNAT family N-acetyltransferase [Clostridium rhizosphaerae]MBL4937619.1 GNAT family N-acetyltransferase [Clostridium rhizosphaerae]